MTKTLVGTAVGALALGSLVTAQALKAPSAEASHNVTDDRQPPRGRDRSGARQLRRGLPCARPACGRGRAVGVAGGLRRPTRPPFR